MGQSALFGLKRLYFDRIFQRSYWTWRRHPTIIIPTMLGTALTVIEQSVITLALILFLTDLARRGALPSFLSRVSQAGVLQILQDPSYSFNLVLLIAVSLVTLFLIAVLGGGFVLSAEYGTYLDAWRQDKASLGLMLEHGIQRWKKMASTYFLTTLVTWGPAAIGYALLLVSILNARTPGGVVAVFISSYVAELLIIASLILSIFTVYSYPAVMVSQLSGLRAIRDSFRTASHNLGITVTYGIVRGIFQLFFTLIVLTASIIGLPLSSLAAAILGLLLTPLLHATKTMVYAYASPDQPEMPFQLADPIWNDIFRRLPRGAWSKVRTGLGEISGFLLNPKNAPFHVASAFAFLVGILWGDYVSSNGLVTFLGIQPGRINPVFQRVILPVLGIDIFLHNWIVSIATALAGIGFGFPSFETILFNGFILGILIPAFPDPKILWAGILPHGIIEIPSFILSGSVGLKLGYAAWKAKFQQGPENSGYLSASLRQAVYIVVGLAPLFLIAGLIEADITPIIIRMVAGT